MDGVKDDWVRVATAMIYLYFQFLDLLLDIILDDLDSLDDDVLKYPLSLLNIHCIFICVVS